MDEVRKKRSEWAVSVKKRDKYRCQNPSCQNKLKKRYKTEAHHILPWRSCQSLRFEKSNGITLCIDCHHKIKNNEHVYAPLFRSIVNAKDKRNSR